ncbi:hypothetical protein QJS10_CPB11g02348 [Acorus calamus]|uniref:Uncharacterized protein n=1 Tax=Acorus calamus TaxID=4465 RepID=A0AAV9DTC7_ACOCL|nr:hypothetical protein QJS10_CPB11g02348 [Acorus calamus]
MFSKSESWNPKIWSLKSAMVITKNVATTLLDTRRSSPVLMCLTTTPSGGRTDRIFLRHGSSGSKIPSSLAFWRDSSDDFRWSTSSASEGY